MNRLAGLVFGAVFIGTLWACILVWTMPRRIVAWFMGADYDPREEHYAKYGYPLPDEGG